MSCRHHCKACAELNGALDPRLVPEHRRGTPAQLPTPAPSTPEKRTFQLCLDTRIDITLPPLAMIDPTPPHTVAPLSHLPQPQLFTIP